jgi:anti-sigma B factor antagonist
MPQPNLLAWPERDLTEPADLRVGIRPDAPPVVQIRGAIDIQSAPPLRDELLRVMRRYGPQLALDLAGVTFLDCAGVNMLLATRRRARLEEGWVRIILASPRALRTISLLGLQDVFALSDLLPAGSFPAAECGREPGSFGIRGHGHLASC